MTIRAILTIYCRKADVYGNRYWAFRFIDCETGKEFSALVDGGEGNITGIRRCGLYGVDGWDQSIHYSVETLPCREFDRLTKGWPYAGCVPTEIAARIAQECGLDCEVAP